MLTIGKKLSIFQPTQWELEKKREEQNERIFPFGWCRIRNHGTMHVVLDPFFSSKDHRFSTLHDYMGIALGGAKQTSIGSKRPSFEVYLFRKWMLVGWPRFDLFSSQTRIKVHARAWVGSHSWFSIQHVSRAAPRGWTEDGRTDVSKWAQLLSFVHALLLIHSPPLGRVSGVRGVAVALVVEEGNTSSEWFLK